MRFVDPKSDTVYEEKLANGARMIRVNKPGVQERPRCYWEMIPVFDNELTIVDGEFRLEHKGSIDQQKVYDLMRVKPLE